MCTIEDVLRNTIQSFTKLGCDSPKAEAELLLMHLLELNRAGMWLNKQQLLTHEQLVTLQQMIARRVNHEPIQYIIGSTNFFGLDFQVGKGVLIPRPETERLVELALESCGQSGVVVDLCTGSGAIALAMAANLSTNFQVYGVDISPEAVAFAQKNLMGNRKSIACDVTLLEGDLFEPLPANLKIDILTSNPPYVTYQEYEELPQNVKTFEPQLALTAPDGGLAIIRKIAEHAPKYLKQDGVIFCEIGWLQGESAAGCFRPYFQEVSVVSDYAGKDRIIRAEKLK